MRKYVELTLNGQWPILHGHITPISSLRLRWFSACIISISNLEPARTNRGTSALTLAVIECAII